MCVLCWSYEILELRLFNYIKIKYSYLLFLETFCAENYYFFDENNLSHNLRICIQSYQYEIMRYDR